MKRFLLLLVLLSCAQQVVVLQPADYMQEVHPRASFNLTASLVQNEIAGVKYEAFAYNGQIPGPILKVKQNDSLTINFENGIPMPTAVHWHGVRVENKYDGAAGVTQKEVQPGGSFEYKLSFPDYGIYWYHPHVREDIQQEKGLAGVILVEPPSGTYNNVSKEEVLVLDDVLLTDQGLPFGASVDHTLMGRFGNVLLVNGRTNYSLEAKTGEVVRLFIVNAANTRMFNFSIEGARLKIVGGDGGLYQNEVWAESVILGPSERAIVEVVFEKAGTYRMMHKNPSNAYIVGEVIVVGEPVVAKKSLRKNLWQFDVSRFINVSPDFEFELDMKMTMMGGMNHNMGSTMQESESGIEWEDTMSVMNARSNTGMIKWTIRNKETGKENMDAMLNAKVGDLKIVRFTNLATSMHPMQHPIHLHGQRFLLLNEKNLVWKDSVVVPAGESVDVLVEFSNPGTWLMHCHIPEHMESGMMTMVEVSQ